MITPVKIQIRFSDLDVLGHVNNSVYLSYFEMARVHYFKELVGENWDWRTLGFVIAKNEVEYIKSVLIEHEPLIYVYTEHIGTKSFALEYELKVNNEIFAKGRSVQVCFDAIAHKTIAIPDKMKTALTTIVRV
jgi:acyl-CoA thioester hydrolase